MVVNCYEEIDDFHRVLKETYFGTIGHINHCKKIFTLVWDDSYCNSIDFDRIECDDKNQIYSLYKTKHMEK